jgi:predicted nucleotide-binding protein
MRLSDVERNITKNVVERFLYENKPSPRKLLARRFRFSQFYKLTDSGILTNTAPGLPTVDEVYLPRSLAFHYCGDPEVQGRAHESVSVVFRTLQSLFDAEPEKSQFTPEDLETQAAKIFDPRPAAETLRLGLYLARDMGILSSWGLCINAIDVASFQIAERIVEMRVFDHVWDDFTARSTATYGDSPQPAASEVDLGDGDILSDLGDFHPMARTPRDAAPAPHQPTIPADLALKRLQKLLAQIPEVHASGHRSSALSTWEGNVRIVLGEFYGENSIPFRKFSGIWFTPGSYYDGQPDSEFVERYNSGLDEAKGFLESRVSDLSEMVVLEKPRSAASSPTAHSDSRRIFVVHGHDHGSKETVARFLGKLGLEPVILHEQADRGKTVIEKFEAHAADVRCAVVILTADDVAYSKQNPEQKELRARQNVILELGYFVGKLGRGRTFALVEKDVALPSDIHGVVYIPLDSEDWHLRLMKELKAAGLDVDANRAFT